MREYGFSLTLFILPFKDRVYFPAFGDLLCKSPYSVRMRENRFGPYMEEYDSVKTRILQYFMQCLAMLPIIKGFGKPLKLYYPS